MTGPFAFRMSSCFLLLSLSTTNIASTPTMFPMDRSAFVQYCSSIQRICAGGGTGINDTHTHTVRYDETRQLAGDGRVTRLPREKSPTACGEGVRTRLPCLGCLRVPRRLVSNIQETHPRNTWRTTRQEYPHALDGEDSSSKSFSAIITRQAGDDKKKNDRNKECVRLRAR